GLAPYFAMQARPLATRGVHAVVWRDNPRAAEILAALNEGLKGLKRNGAYASLVQQHLMAAEAPVVAAARKQEPAPPPAAVAAGAAPPAVSKQAAAGAASLQGVAPAQPPATAAAKPAPAASPLPAPTPATPPALDQAARAIALKFLKRGDEELAEGRVAP